MDNRRQFIKKAGLGLTVAGLSSTALSGDSQSEIIQDKTLGTVNGEEKVVLKVKKPLFCPYHSLETKAEKGGGGHYYRNDAFDHNPFTIKASGMSGSPVIVDADGKFVGFMTTHGYEKSTFSFDGKDTLTINVPAGQELYLDEKLNGDKSWKAYNSEMMRRLEIQPLKNYPDFWADVEYCTWVEQKKQSKVRRGHFHLLNHDFVKSYLDKVIEFDYPKGKMTLDHGWGEFPDGSVDSGFGSWKPNSKHFPNFRKTMDMIKEKGFTPGLWIGFPKIHVNSSVAQSQPNLLGNWDAKSIKFDKNAVRYLNSMGDIFSYASDVISRFYNMGVMKFKIDMSYNTKSDMLHIHKDLYRAAKEIDPNIEMEFHVPDIFFAKYTDVIRTNDVWLNDKYDWKSRVETHYKVTSQSCPGRGINLDHIGGNDTKALTEEKYLEHLNMYKTKKGYPLVSLLPHHIGQKSINATGLYLWEYSRGKRNIISEFHG